MTPSRLLDLEEGEITDGLDERDLFVAQLVKGHLDAGAKQCAVFEHSMAHPSDPVVQRSTVPWFAFGGEVYYYLLGPGHTIQAVRHLIATAQTYRLVGVLTEAPSELVAKHASGAVTHQTVAALAAATSRVIVLAWHMTGKVIWDVSEHEHFLATSSSN